MEQSMKVVLTTSVSVDAYVHAVARLGADLLSIVLIRRRDRHNDVLDERRRPGGENGWN
jgi:hypothetical protein